VCRGASSNLAVSVMARRSSASFVRTATRCKYKPGTSVVATSLRKAAWMSGPRKYRGLAQVVLGVEEVRGVVGLHIEGVEPGFYP